MAMAKTRGFENLGAARDMIMPGVNAVVGRAAAEGIPIRKADVWVDYAEDELQLCVSYGLLNRMDMYRTNDYIPVLAQRLQAAMRLFHRMPAAKALCVDRRQLSARGEKARKMKAKRA